MDINEEAARMAKYIAFATGLPERPRYPRPMPPAAEAEYQKSMDLLRTLRLAGFEGSPELLLQLESFRERNPALAALGIEALELAALLGTAGARFNALLATLDALFRISTIPPRLAIDQTYPTGRRIVEAAIEHQVIDHSGEVLAFEGDDEPYRTAARFFRRMGIPEFLGLEEQEIVDWLSDLYEGDQIIELANFALVEAQRQGRTIAECVFDWSNLPAGHGKDVDAHQALEGMRAVLKAAEINRGAINAVLTNMTQLGMRGLVGDISTLFGSI
jgi:hypothetical protein